MISVEGLWRALVETLGVQFVLHKIEGRIPMFAWEQYTMAADPCDSFKCRMPGLIVSHQPLTNGQAAFVVPLYVIFAYGVVWIVLWLQKQHGHTTVSSYAILAWAAFESHHSQYPEMLFSHLFVRTAFQLFLPATLLLAQGSASVDKQFSAAVPQMKMMEL